LKALATTLHRDVHAFRRSVAVQDTVDELSLHPGAVEARTFAFDTFGAKKTGTKSDVITSHIGSLAPLFSID